MSVRNKKRGLLKRIKWTRVCFVTLLLAAAVATAVVLRSGCEAADIINSPSDSLAVKPPNNGGKTVEAVSSEIKIPNKRDERENETQLYDIIGDTKAFSKDGLMLNNAEPECTLEGIYTGRKADINGYLEIDYKDGEPYISEDDALMVETEKILPAGVI